MKTEELFRVRTGFVAETTVLRGGKLTERKSIALPGVEIYPPTLTGSDLQNIRDAKRYGITGVMLPFVRNQEDLKKLKQELIKENAGDLGNALPLWELPVIQARIAAAGAHPVEAMRYMANTVRAAEEYIGKSI